uniref:Uncharacterized protein n=2 Tax=Paramoeba aestuarina TaxID=180227 RepID=A0A7S4PH46_9EUKA|mmetsp:Transcript_5560/g.8415  ORF Transcript_5560/g.8415 Transcript_5560/m.8415 type:complete len:132 (+) Transcript_5560:301-696(+)
MGVAFWLMGPFPVADVVASQVTILVSMALLGCFCGLVSIPSLPDAQFCAEKKKEGKAVKSLISGYWGAVYASAAFVGGPIGGVLYGQIGFVGLNFVSACSSAIMAVLSGLIGFYWFKFDPFSMNNGFLIID